MILMINLNGHLCLMKSSHLLKYNKDILYFELFIFIYLQADNLVGIIDSDNIPCVISHRLNSMNTPPIEKIPISTHLTLQEILIVGNCSEQVCLICHLI